MSSVGERIKQRRHAAELTQQGLAEILKIDYKQVWRWETGRTIPSTEMLIQLAYALNTTPDWLLGFVDDADRPLDNLSEDELTWLELWRSKRPEQRKRMLDVVKLL